MLNKLWLLRSFKKADVSTNSVSRILFQLFVCLSAGCLITAQAQAITVDLVQTKSWSGGFIVDASITNDTNTMINGWTLGFKLGNKIEKMSRATFTGSDPYVVKNLSYSAEIAPNTSEPFSFTAVGTLNAANVSGCVFNGDTCNLTVNGKPVGGVSSSLASSEVASSVSVSSSPASSTPESSKPASSTPESSTPASSTPESSTPAAASSTPATSSNAASSIASSIIASSQGASSRVSGNVVTPSNLMNAINNARAGDTIILADGTYNDKAISVDLDNFSIVAANGGKAIFTGKSSIHFGGNNVLIQGLLFQNGGTNTEVIRFRSDAGRDATNSTVTDIAIHNYNENSTGSKPWVSILGTGNKVANSAFYKKTSQSAFVQAPHVGNMGALNHVIQNNWFGYRAPQGNNHHALGIGSNALPDVMAKVTVKRNYFESCSGEAEVMSIKASGNLITENFITKSKGAIVLRRSKNSIVDRNIIQNSSAGIRFYYSGNKITNNYMSNLSSFGLTVGNGDGTLYNPAVDAQIANNTFVDVGAILIGDKTTYDTAARNISLNDNLIVKTPSGSAPNEVIDSRVTYRAIGSQSVGYKSKLRDLTQFTGAVTYKTVNGMVFPAANGLTAGVDVSSLFRVARDSTSATDPARVGPTWYNKPTN